MIKYEYFYQEQEQDKFHFSAIIQPKRLQDIKSILLVNKQIQIHMLVLKISRLRKYILFQQKNKFILFYSQSKRCNVITISILCTKREVEIRVKQEVSGYISFNFLILLFKSLRHMDNDLWIKEPQPESYS